MKSNSFKVVFSEFIPEEIKEGVLYISMEYATASHKCACGCGNEVVTPFSPTDWKLQFNGESVSLAPSIGNWSYPCRAHYLIRSNRVVWANDMSQEAIDAGRRRDMTAKAAYYSNGGGTERRPKAGGQPQSKSPSSDSGGFWNAIARFIGIKK